MAEKPNPLELAGRKIYSDTYGKELAEYLNSPKLEPYFTDKYKRTKSDNYILRNVGRDEKKIDALMMADAEFMAALEPHLKDRPIARIGLDSYAFDAGNITAKNYKKRLLNIESEFTAGVRASRGRLLKGAYDPGSDKIQVYEDVFEPTYYAISGRDKRMGKSRITSAGNKPRTRLTQLPNQDYGQFLQTSRKKITDKQEIERAKKVDGLVTLLHELEHRGLDVLDKLTDQRNYEADYVKSSYEKRLVKHEDLEIGKRISEKMADEHQGIYARDMEDYRDLGSVPDYRLMPTRTREYYPSSKINYEQETYMGKTLKENPELGKRFPSITKKKKRTGGVVKNKYATGGKVYSNTQSRKVRI